MAIKVWQGILAMALLGGLMSCASTASPEQMAALQDQRNATQSAEEHAHALQAERDGLRLEVAHEQARTAHLQTELDTLLRRLP